MGILNLLKTHKKLITNLLIMFMGVILVLYNTEPGNNPHVNNICQSIIVTFEILCILVFIRNQKKHAGYTCFLDIVKENILFILYFLVRFITFVYYDYDIVILRSIFMEFFCLVIVSNYLIMDTKTPYQIFEIFIVFVCAANLASILIPTIYAIPELLESGSNLVSNLSALYSKSTIFVNINTNGVLTGLSLVFGHLFVKERDKWWLYVLYILYAIVAVTYLLLIECRSAQMGIFVAFVAYLFVKLTKNIKPRDCVIGFFFLSFVYVLVMFCTAYANPANKLTPFEQRWNKVSTNRYTLSKYAIKSMDGKWLTGVGAANYVSSNRWEWIKSHKEESGINTKLITKGRTESLSQRFCHNMYLDYLISNGILCFILFILIMIKKISRISPHGMRKYYLSLIYIMAIGLFENLLLNKYFYMFFCLMLVIAFAQNDKDSVVSVIDTNKDINSELKEAKEGI